MKSSVRTFKLDEKFVKGLTASEKKILPILIQAVKQIDKIWGILSDPIKMSEMIGPNQDSGLIYFIIYWEFTKLGHPFLFLWR